MTGTILLTGGTGKTASRIAKRLQEKGIPFLLTSRKGQAAIPAEYKGVEFDWFKESTFENPFIKEKIETVYIVFPSFDPAYDSVALVKKFIDLAKERGVKRFLLLTATMIEKGGPAHGQIHAHLDTIDVDYAVLRPSRFFSEYNQ